MLVELWSSRGRKVRTVAYTQAVWLVVAAAAGCSDGEPRTHAAASVVDASSADSSVQSGAIVAEADHAQTQQDTASDAGRDVSAQPLDAAAPATNAPQAAKAPQEAPTKLGREALGTSPLPCELRSVLETSCQSCHGREPGGLAPMALTSREDLLAPAISQPMRRVYELVKERIHSDKAPMPPASSRRLTSAELATLDNALDAEIAAGPEKCEGTLARQAMYPDPDPSEIEQCYPMHVYEAGNVKKPFRVTPGERYACFSFDIPWQENAQAVSIRIQRSRLVHHWGLFDGLLPEGTVLVTEGDCGLGAETLYAAGSISPEDVINTPPSVGTLMPAKSSGKRMQLSVHYSNMGEEAVDDTFGVDICIARTPREHTAEPQTVGTFELSLPPHQATEIVRHCKPKYDGEIHLIQIVPHMHTRATRYSLVIERTNGSREPLLDVPFDANNQITYALDSVLKTGDSLTTTCYFQNDTDRTIIWGTSSNDEMCGANITAWPAGSLSNGDPKQAANTCVE